MIKMVGFDLDGTICDSLPMCMEAFMNAVIPYTDHELSEKEIVSTFGLNEAGMIKAVVKNDWEAALDRFYENYQNLHNMCITPFEGIRELIGFLKQNHILVPLITGKGEKTCEITLTKLGLNQTFDDILYGSEKYPCKKENIIRLLEKYAIEKNEFYYIGDTLQDAADCHSIGVTCLSAAWAEYANPQILKDCNPYTFESVAALKKFLDIAVNQNKPHNPL